MLDRGVQNLARSYVRCNQELAAKLGDSMLWSMKLCRIHDCLCDATRLRIVHLLLEGPLCVCHFQELLGLTQVAVSKHLAYLRARELVESRRYQNWMIYSLPVRIPPAMQAHLDCLQQSATTEPILRVDAKKLAAMRPKIGWLAEAGCCAEAPAKKTAIKNEGSAKMRRIVRLRRAG